MMKMSNMNIDLKEALKRWDDNDPVWSIEMSGLGPGYEQCIQYGIFELTKVLSKENLDIDEENIDILLDNKLSELCKKEKILISLTGAQAVAIKQVSYKFAKNGYKETLNSVLQDRLIQVNKFFV